MSKKAWIGIALILLGIIAFLGNLGLFRIQSNFWGGFILIALGIAFFAFFGGRVRNWWVLIPGHLFTFLGVSLWLNALISRYSWSGIFLFLGMAVAFIWIHLLTEYWWSIIPGGASLVLAVVLVLGEFNLASLAIRWFVFCLGLGLVFGYLFLIKDEKNKLDWAKWPAGILLVVALIILASTLEERIGNVVVSVVLIAAGIYLVVQGLQKETKAPEVEKPPQEAEVQKGENE